MTTVSNDGGESPYSENKKLLSRRVALREIGLATASLTLAASTLAACATKPDNKLTPADADAHIDFTSKPDGDPPKMLDSGQPVNFVQTHWKPPRQPRVADGALVHGELPDTGAFANYFQAQIGGDCRSFGATWTVDDNDGSSSSGVMCIAAWAGIYESGSGMTVPRTPGHIVVDTITGEWQWWISDGKGKGAEHLKVVKAGTCAPPASDGKSAWEIAVYLDPAEGKGRLRLPGPDITNGSRDIVLNDTEIANALSALQLPVATIASTSHGATVVMVEHFANRDPRSARYPRFLSMWANTHSTSATTEPSRPQN
ncbi:MAG: hypothetical protein HZA88_05865 [Verrucomicrobia bacterium]|nr:hypothetical protein [Verrucomicrobiota bacterium]